MQPIFRRPSVQLLTALGVVALIGCNTGSHTKSTTTPTTPTITLNAVTIASSTSALIGQAGGVNALIFQLVNPSTTADITLNSVTITAAGTANDPTMITTLTLREDLDASATITGGDRIIATSANPAFTTDNGTSLLTVTSTPGATIPRNTSRQYIVTFDTIANPGATTAGTAVVGSTITLSIAGASSISAVGTGSTLAFTGLPTTADTVTLGIASHLLITEIVTTTAAEYVEIYNPTGTTIDLTNVHLSDFTSIIAGMRYDVLPTGTNYHDTGGRGNTTTSDFAARFPAAALGPGSYATIAIDGAQFTTAYTQAPTFALKNAGAGTQLMGTWDGVAGSFNFSNSATGFLSASTDFLPAGGEPIYLYTWNGSVMASAPDLVTDLDMVVYGTTTAIPAADMPTFKGAAAQDGPDTGATTTAYPAETAAATQAANRIQAVVGQVVYRRTNYLEGNQATTGGNGLGGSEETSENWSATFTTSAAGTATPKAP